MFTSYFSEINNFLFIISLHLRIIARMNIKLHVLIKENAEELMVGDITVVGRQPLQRKEKKLE